MQAGTPIDQDPSFIRTQAWLIWLGSLLVPGVCLLVAIGVQGFHSSPSHPITATLLCLVATLWLVIALPGAMLLRSHVLKGQLAGQPIQGRRYVKGMGTIWGAAAIGGGLAGIGCIAGGGLMPAGVPLLIAIATILTLGPFKPAILEDVAKQTPPATA